MTYEELENKYKEKEREVYMLKWEVKNITRKLDYLCKQLDRACEKARK